jgi:hypothetical protein
LSTRPATAPGFLLENIMNKAKMFLSLNPVEAVRYSACALDAYGRLDEAGDSHGENIWLCRGRVFVDEGVVVDNTYYGKRTPPQQVRL